MREGQRKGEGGGVLINSSKCLQTQGGRLVLCDGECLKLVMVPLMPAQTASAKTCPAPLQRPPP